MRGLWLLALLALSCRGDDPVENSGLGNGGSDPGDTDDATACGEDSECEGWEICESDECVDGDRNNAIDEAQVIRWDDTVSEWTNTEGDIDYFALSADGGEFLRVEVATEATDPWWYVEVRRDNGKVLTSSYAFATGTSLSDGTTVAFAYLDGDGDYYITVEDGWAHYDYGGNYGQDYDYSLTVEEWDATTDETDAFDDPNEYVDVDTERIWSTVGAVLEEGGDVDYVAINLNVSGQTLYIDGNEDLQGSDATPLFRLLDGEGNVLSRKEDVGPDGYMILPMADEGSYVLELSDADGGGGDSYWMYAHIIARAHEFEAEDESNDDTVTADGIDLTEYTNSSGKPYSVGDRTGVLDGEGDTDWFAIDAPYEDTWFVVCLNSSTYGSTVAPTIEVYDAGEELLESQEGSETATPTNNLENVAVSQGSYYLHIVPPDGALLGPGAWYQLYLYAASFEVSSYDNGGYSCP